jgi:uncharacterized protein YebE (UPF0316 family)
MDILTTWNTIGLGLVICLARIADVSMGTMRTISIVQGRTWMAFGLGFVEISVWLAVISTTIPLIKESPWLGLFYALGFALGNLAGIKLERRLAFGNIILRVITRGNGEAMAEELRDDGYVVTTFSGRGRSGPVTELYIVCRRRDFRSIIATVQSIDPQAFYVTEQAGNVNKLYRPTGQLPTGWRAWAKKK